MYLDGDAYVRPMNKFLNDFSDKMNKSSPANFAMMRDIFIKTIALVEACLPNAFRLVRALNAAVFFDSVMVGLAVRIDSGSSPDGARVKAAYDALLVNTTTAWHASDLPPTRKTFG